MRKRNVAEHAFDADGASALQVEVKSWPSAANQELARLHLLNRQAQTYVLDDMGHGGLNPFGCMHLDGDRRHVENDSSQGCDPSYPRSGRIDDNGRLEDR